MGGTSLGLAHSVFPVQNFPAAPPVERTIQHTLKPLTCWVRICRDQGAFAAGAPKKESYNRAATPATIATSAKLNTYQLKVFSPI